MHTGLIVQLVGLVIAVGSIVFGCVGASALEYDAFLYPIIGVPIGLFIILLGLVGPLLR